MIALQGRILVRIEGLPQLFASLACLDEFLVSLLEYMRFASCELVVGCYIADGAVESYGIVMAYIVAGHALGILDVEGCFGADALLLEAFVPAFDLAVALGVKGAGSHMGHAGEANELLEVFGDKLRPVVGDDAWCCIGESFSGFLEDEFDLALGHGFLNIPVNNGSAVAIEDAAEVIKGSRDIDIRHIGMPMLVGCQRLGEAGTLFGRFAVESVDSAGVFEHTINTRRAGGGDIGVEHHKGQSAIPFERVLPFEVENGLFFGWGKPMVAWYPCVVLVDLSKALFPMVELAGRESQPLYELPHGQTGAC